MINWFEVNSSRVLQSIWKSQRHWREWRCSTANTGEIKYYGYEEGDESVDVVHRSVPNNRARNSWKCTGTEATRHQFLRTRRKSMI